MGLQAEAVVGDDQADLSVVKGSLGCIFADLSSVSI